MSKPFYRRRHNEVSEFLGALHRRDVRYTAELAAGGHWKIMYGERIVTFTGGSPRGGRRSLENLKAEIKRFERTLIS